MGLLPHRYAVKLMYDEACLGEVDNFAELVEYLRNYDNSSFIGCEDEKSWKQAVLQEVPNLFSLGYNANNVRLIYTHYTVLHGNALCISVRNGEG